MSKQLPLGIWLVLGLLFQFILYPVPVQADTIHIRYFESIDTPLEQGHYKIFSTTAHQDELITVIVYGLTGHVQPGVSLLSPDGMTLVEDRNLMGRPAAMIQIIAPQTGTYPILVTRQRGQDGLVRVMIFEGAPLDHDVVIQDTADPYLPGRAFLIAGSSHDPVETAISVMPDADETDPRFFASRGSTTSPPPPIEEQQPTQYSYWLNDNPMLYTIQVQPETTETGLLDFQLTVNEGNDLIIMDRPVCDCQVVTTTASVRVGPGRFYMQVDELSAHQPIEVLGISRDQAWVQIADASRMTGISWIPASAVSGLGQTDCHRISTVNAPPSTETIIRNVASDPSDANLIFLVQAYSDDPVLFEAAYENLENELGLIVSSEEQALLDMLMNDADLTEAEQQALREMVVEPDNGKSETVIVTSPDDTFITPPDGGEKSEPVDVGKVEPVVHRPDEPTSSPAPIISNPPPDQSGDPRSAPTPPPPPNDGGGTIITPPPPPPPTIAPSPTPAPTDPPPPPRCDDDDDDDDCDDDDDDD